jgi:hypothetical protein
LLCCLCAIILISTGLISSTVSSDVMPTVEIGDKVTFPKPINIRPEELPIEVTNNTLDILKNTEVPINDLIDLAHRFEGKKDIPTAMDPVLEPLEIGTQESFWALNTDTEENFRINATLQYVTEHAYFWIEDGVRYRSRALKKLAETFESQIYPTNRKFFGSEWTPGVDGDPHIYIIYAEGLGRSLAGYFSPSDEYHTLAHEYSNMHETFMFNADNLQLDEEYTYGVLSHEFQHMIQWYQDRNEDAWVNEGLSELASNINGYDIGGFDTLYTGDPDLQLNDWPNDPGNTAPYYGASFLFHAYFLDRFGFNAIQMLARHPKNGLAGVDAVLSELGSQDPLSMKPIRADDVFLDWTLATYINEKKVSDGRFNYYRYDRVIEPSDTEIVDSCPMDLESRNVYQYGVDYIRIDCKGDFILKFQGSTEVGLLPTEPYSGDFAFWSNKGDDSDMTLTKEFDFSDYDGQLTLTYWTWYDIEVGYDYAYLTVSQDGESWKILMTPSGTTEDPSGSSYGWAYNGLSGGNGRWIQESVDISQYAGDQVEIRFEYITDGAVNGEGFLLDDITIPEIGYFSDFETDDDGWGSAGFVRIQNSLPQTFRLALLEEGDLTEVIYIELGPENGVEIPIHLGGEVDEVVLVVTGTTRFTRQKANYVFQILP